MKFAPVPLHFNCASLHIARECFHAFPKIVKGNSVHSHTSPKFTVSVSIKALISKLGIFQLEVSGEGADVQTRFV
jgi:hypothetical protein